MDRGFFFERNLLALSRGDPGLCSRLSTAETTLGRYKFIESRSGEPIPATLDASGTAHPLHSLVDPRKEGTRLAATLGDEGFLIILGLGGGFHVAAALERGIEQVVVVEYDINGIAELLSSGEYIHIFNDPRFHLLVDAPAGLLEQYIVEQYQPALYGGIGVLSLRTRTDGQPLFREAGEAVKAAIDTVSGDYSVQAYFGKRWFSNIIRNLPMAEAPAGPVPPVRHAAICAAGPSLDIQLPRLAQRRSSRFLIATDTSLPALLGAGLEPDAVISIDCQHISYYHFMAGLPGRIPLFLDLASPPLVASRSRALHFFSGGHPLTRYISRYWRPFPAVDTSGANVTYAALSLADTLGARDIELYGADFSYPLGRTYARGTYLYPYFEYRQSRLSPLEALFSNFLYRGPLKRVEGEHAWYYETPSLTRYRRGMEEKIPAIRAKVLPEAGLGAPLLPGKIPPGEFPAPLRIFSSGKAAMGARDFLAGYRARIEALPPMERGIAAYLEGLDQEAGRVFTTLLPAAAAIKHRQPELSRREILEEVKDYCIEELGRVL
ncbi:MAG: DUF115 domain-containing protein [Treponema sp.]|jgi:hypothetical protein|nr:DUF115 domain-containing protein [Treponema sp.]